MDEKLYADLAAATKYYVIVNEFDERIHKEKENIRALNTCSEQSKQEKLASNSLIGKISLWVAIITGIIFLPAVIVVMTAVLEPNADDMILIPLLGIAFVVSLFVTIGSRSKKKQIIKKCNEEYEAQIKPQIEESKSKIASLQSDLQKFTAGNHHVVKFLPSTYRDVQATSYMLLAVSDGRANTLKEAMNLYEEQLHRWKLEEYARQSAEAQEYYALAMDELNSRQAQTNAHLQEIETQFSNYFNN